MAQNGPQDSSGKSLTLYETVELMSDAATNVIPLVIVNKNLMHNAHNAVVLNVSKKGLIPQTYISYRKEEGLPGQVITSRLRDTLGQKNVSFSVVCETADRILICASSCRATSKLQRDPG